MHIANSHKISQKENNHARLPIHVTFQAADAALRKLDAEPTILVHADGPRLPVSPAAAGGEGDWGEDELSGGDAGGEVWSGRAGAGGGVGGGTSQTEDPNRTDKPIGSPILQANGAKVPGAHTVVIASYNESAAGKRAVVIIAYGLLTDLSAD